MSRVDLFSPIHKGLRGALFEFATDVARVELSSTHAIDRLVAQVERVLAYLDEHADHEDSHTFVALRGLSPELADELAGDHHALDIVQREVERLAHELALADLARREEAAAKLGVAINHLVAMQLIHMNREETLANEALWTGLGDDALVALRSRLVATIPAARYAEWIQLVGRFTSPVERHLVDNARVG